MAMFVQVRKVFLLLPEGSWNQIRGYEASKMMVKHLHGEKKYTSYPTFQVDQGSYSSRAPAEFEDAFPFDKNCYPL